MKKIKDTLPSDLLIKNDKLIARITEHDEKLRRSTKYDKASSFFYSTLITIFSIIIPAPAIFSTLYNRMTAQPLTFVNCVLILFQILSLVGLVLAFTVSLIRMFTYRKDKKTTHDLHTEITSDIIKSMKYTGIILIADCSDSSNLRFLLGNYEEEEFKYFFPFIKMNPELSVEEQKNLIVNHLTRTFDVNEADILEVTSYDDVPFFSIKPVARYGLIEEHAFVFYCVRFNYNVKRFLRNQYRDAWMSLHELMNNPSAMAYNRDIISRVEDMMGSLRDSFVTIPHPLKIVWNITSKCHYDCAICATKDIYRPELDYFKKTKVLHHLVPLKERIAKIDFSGGDPCGDDENLSIINTAIGMFGASKIAVTTTGYGLSRACLSTEYRETVRRCEITIDALGSSDQGKHRNPEQHYYDENIEGVIENIINIFELTINVPIISSVLQNDDLTKLINNILEIKSHKINVKVNLIRLMPVGAMATFGYPADYNPTNPIAYITKELRKHNIDVSIHCSLKVSKCASGYPRSTKASCCNMAIKKIGIDCAGNVFSCGWAGYIANKQKPTSLIKPEDNPFYLGNVLETRLDVILSEDNQRYKTLTDRIEKSLNGKISYCPVVSYYNNPQWYKNTDPLSS